VYLIPHQGYEYADCALLACVSPSSAAAMTKTAMIGVRNIGLLPVRVFACVMLSVLLRRWNDGGQEVRKARMPEITWTEALNEDSIPKGRRLLLIATPKKRAARRP